MDGFSILFNKPFICNSIILIVDVKVYLLAIKLESRLA
jgi:hypothetical protein